MQSTKNYWNKVKRHKPKQTIQAEHKLVKNIYIVLSFLLWLK
jgi:hypothetical protein